MTVLVVGQTNANYALANGNNDLDLIRPLQGAEKWLQIDADYRMKGAFRSGEGPAVALPGLKDYRPRNVDELL